MAKIGKSIYKNQQRVMVPYSKLGIKILSDTQLQNIFPTCEILLDRIEAHRKGLSQIDSDRLKLIKSDIQYNLMFDNVYSIMGKRGAGKTSVVFSLKEILKGQNPGLDLILPIIMPEMIPKDCSMIGWILSLLEDHVKKLDEQLVKFPTDKYSSDKFSGCMKQRRHEGLTQIYEQTKDLYYAQYYNVEHADSFIDAVINTDKMTQNSYNFSKQLIRFWDFLIEAVKIVNGDKKEEPLIHIIFDDVDLVPEAAINLFSTIIKYLSHPNIVVYVTADEELIFDVIENNMTKRLEKVTDLLMYNHVIGGLKRAYDDEDTEDLESFNDDINRIRKKILIKEELIHETPKRYGEKVLPPSCRYYLETFESIDKKKNFIVDWHNEETGKDELCTIEKFVINEINRYLKEVQLGVKDNFVLINKGEKEQEFVVAYLLFWGSTSRQITNEVYILNEFINRLIKIHKKYRLRNQDKNDKGHYCRRVYQAVREFAYTTLIVSGSVHLRSDEIQELLDVLFVYDEQNGGVYIDYLSLRERAQQKNEYLNDTRLENRLRETISLFVLAFFIENFLKYENSINVAGECEERKKVHGMGLLVDVLDYYVNGKYSLVCKKLMDDVPGFLWYYGKLLDQPHTLLNFNISDPRTLRDYFATLPKYTLDNKSIVELYRTSPLWTNTITQILYFSNERIYNITKKELDVIRFIREDYYFYDLYYTEQYHETRNELVDVLSNLENTDSDNELIERYKYIYLKDNVINNKFDIEYLQYETLVDVHERMREGVSQDQFQIKCALIGRNESSQQFSHDFGTPECTDILFKELQNTREKINECFYKFKYHLIYDVDIVENCLANISIRSSLNVKKLEISDNNEAQSNKRIINTKDLNNLFNQIDSKNMPRVRYRFSGYRQEELLNDAYRTVLNQCTSVITSQEEFEIAKRAIILFNYYSIIQKLYIVSFQKQAELTDYHYIDKNLIPYKEFYEGDDGIKERMKKADYLGLTLRYGISEKIEARIQSLLKGSD